MRGSGKAFLAAWFTFFGDMKLGEFLRIEMWMLVYIVISLAALFLAFNPGWLKRRTLWVLAITGSGAAFIHRASIDCSGPINQLDTFNFLGCVGGYEMTYVAIGLSSLILILSFLGDTNGVRHDN